MDRATVIKLKCVLENLLPSSIQLYNIIACQLSNDGIERKIVVNEDFSEEKIALMVVNRLEAPKLIVSLFCTDNCQEVLREYLVENIDWNGCQEFEVKFNEWEIPFTSTASSFRAPMKII